VIDLVVRPYGPADREAVTTLVREVLAEFGFSLKVGGLEQDLAEIEKRYDGGRAGFWVAEGQARIVGTVAIRPKDGAACELKRLYLVSAARGVGAGQKLYAHAEAFARSAGYERIHIDSSRRFVRAHALYARNGFTLVEQLKNEWEDNVYEKSLLS
jgi:GNAT superfamily N-acetyltransferase